MKPAICILLLGLASCSTPQLVQREPVIDTEPAARRLLADCQKAHGAKAYRKIQDITVRYEGKWGKIGPRFQPELVDKGFRKDSEEHLILSPRKITQTHTGPEGTKLVIRDAQSAKVSYNGKVSDDPIARQAAALVADAYQLFLLGPFYFDRKGVTLRLAGQMEVNGAQCDQIMAILTPGFGEAKEDRVILCIDHSTRLLKRVRMSLNGLESTIGAEVDITFAEHKRIGGVLWSTDFDERIRVPFDLHAHHWKLTDLKLTPLR